MLDENLMAHQTNADSKAKLVYKQQYSASEHYASPCLVPYSPELTVDSIVALVYASTFGVSECDARLCPASYSLEITS